LTEDGKPTIDLARLKHHDHVCLIQDPEEEWPTETIVAFLEQGLHRGEKCLYILEAHRTEEVRNRLHASGLNVTALRASGQLVFYESESYTKSLSFEPNRVMAVLIAEADKAMAEGHRALRVADEMAWALPGRPGSEKVLEYEAKLNRDFFPRYPCLALCQYHRAKFEPEIIKGALTTHPLVVSGHHLYRNDNYISPDGFLGVRNSQHEIDHLLANLERQRKDEERTQAMQEAVQEIAQLVEARDPYSAGHQQRVTRLACGIAEEMSLPVERVEALRQAGMLHDIGKIYVHVDILTKPGRLVEEEFEEVKAHPEAGSQLLKRMAFPHPIPDIVLQHHERLDGSGYPQGLSGDDILMEARILAVADVVEAMSLGRSYRDGLGIAKALQDISWNKGILYDTKAVDACLRLFTERGYRFHDK
jgi:putative nucleotidyltransferase with HDIG domain